MLLNDPKTAALLLSAAQAVLGPKNASYLPPIMASEDFAFFTEQRPGAMMRLGCSNHEKGITHKLHSPRFEIEEDVPLWARRSFTRRSYGAWRPNRPEGLEASCIEQKRIADAEKTWR